MFRIVGTYAGHAAGFRDLTLGLTAQANLIEETSRYLGCVSLDSIPLPDPTLLIPVALAQTSRSDQKPRSQPAWPCTGNEPSFDPAYAKAAEATGGQLFLLDRSEAGRSAELIIATSRHRETIARVAGKLDGSYRDVRVPVDSSVHSLLVSGTVQCMQTIAIYGPNNIPPEQMGGENHWFRAGRILNVPNPEPGVWTIRLQGGSPFFLSMQADTSLVRARLGLHRGSHDWELRIFSRYRSMLRAPTRISDW